MRELFEKYEPADGVKPSRKQIKADKAAVMSRIEGEKPTIKLTAGRRLRAPAAAAVAVFSALTIGTVSVGAYYEWDLDKVFTGIFSKAKQGSTPAEINLDAFEIERYGRPLDLHYDYEDFSLDVFGVVSDGKAANVMFGVTYDNNELIPCYDEFGNTVSGLVPYSKIVTGSSDDISGTVNDVWLNFDGKYGTFGVSAYDDTLAGKKVTFDLSFFYPHDDLMPTIAEQELTIDLSFIENTEYIGWNSENCGEYTVYSDDVHHLDELEGVTESDCAFTLDSFFISPFGIGLKLKESDSPLYGYDTAFNIAYNGLGCTRADGTYIDLLADIRVSNNPDNAFMANFLYPIDISDIVSITIGGATIPLNDQ